jgi:mannose-1-phosphate guanylyltransferase
MASIGAHDPDAMLIVLPADHVIEPVAEFERMVRRAVAIAEGGEAIVTFGVRPTSPATGFGYIECGDRLDQGEPHAFAARSFREKPDAATARQYVDSGAFRWNSGIFVFTIASMQRAMANGEPELAAATERMTTALRAGRRAQATRAFRQAPRTSIDYAVMEKAERLVVVEATANWDDVGSFPALEATTPADADGNHAVLTDGAALAAVRSRGNIVYAEGRRTVALFGVNDIVVAAVGDAVLVCPKERAADLKQLVDHLRTTGRDDLL